MTDTGTLNGVSILRFAHAFETGGGTERYLDDLDRALLARNAMTIVRLHLTRNPSSHSPSEEHIGMGRLICVPLQIIPGAISSSPSNLPSIRDALKKRVRDWLLYNPLFW